MTVLGRKIEMDSVLRAALAQIVASANYLSSQLGNAAYAGMTIALTFFVFIYALVIGDTVLGVASVVLSSVNLLVMVYRLTDGSLEMVMTGTIMLTVACVLGISIGVANATSQSINFAVGYGIAMAAVLVPSALLMIRLRKWQAESEKRADDHFTLKERAFIEKHRDAVLKHFSIHQSPLHPDRWLLTDLSSDKSLWRDSEYAAYRRAVSELERRANPAAYRTRVLGSLTILVAAWAAGITAVLYFYINILGRR